MTQWDKEEAGMKAAGRARARNQTFCLCLAPHSLAEVWLGKRRAYTDLPHPVFPPICPCQPGWGTEDANLATAQPGAESSHTTDSPSAPLPPPKFPAWPCLVLILKMCLFPPLFLCTPRTELYGGEATSSLSIGRVIFHLVSYRHGVFAIAACVCLYLSVHVFLSFALLATSKPICHIQLHLAERLTSEDIAFLEGFWRRNITLTLLRRQEGAEMYLQLRVCQGTCTLPGPTCKGWTNEMEEGNGGQWSGGGFRGCKCLGNHPSVPLLREWFILWGTWMFCMCYVQMQLGTLQVTICKKIQKKIERECSLHTPERQLLHWPTQCRSRRWCRTNIFRLLLSSREQSLGTVSDFSLSWCPAWVWWRGQSLGSAVLIREGRGLVHSQFSWCRARVLQGVSV